MKYSVMYLLKCNEKTVGIEIINDETMETYQVPASEFYKLKGKLENAIVTVNGVVRGKNKKLPIKKVSEIKNNYSKKISNYIIMYKDIEVLNFNLLKNTVKVINKNYLPFGLRRENITPVAVQNWITDRISNIERTYMNMVYIARCVGRDNDKVLKDSLGISFTDNFWIKTNDIKVTWPELKKYRDKNDEINKIALTGIIDSSKNLTKYFTSLFTTKGHFPKAIIGDYIYKLKEDALLEYPAYLIGLQMGVNVSQCELYGDFVKIRIFTNENKSLVHASELKLYYGTDDEIYNIFSQLKNTNILKQLQRMYIFNYVIGNPDLHDDNYGLLYDSETFKFISLAPCFDHNVAFNTEFIGLCRGRLSNSSFIELDRYAEIFIKYHKDIVEKLEKIDLSEVQKYLSNRQLKQLKERINNVIKWFYDN